MSDKSPKIVDARGLACPQPVILTRKAMADAEALITIVDNETSQHNVSRMAEKQGYRVRVEQRPDGLYLHLTRGEAGPQSQPQAPIAPVTGPVVLLIASEFLGQGDDVLGGVLMRAFLHTLGESQPLPDALILINSGVKLATEGSPVLDDLRALRDCGVEVLACGTCLKHFGLMDRVAVGEVSNMYAIVEQLLAATQVLRM